MNTARTSTLTWMAAIAATTLVAAFAFSAADTGARSVDATVATDADAFLALEANAVSPHKDFVTQGNDGKLAVAFGSGVATGAGINPDSTYTFDALINVTNKGTASKAFDISISGADAALCQVAFTSGATQASGDYSADPTALTLSVGGKAYLGLKVDATAKTSGQTVACAITVTAV